MNLGCGRRKKDGYLNVDINSSCQPDLVHDLEKFPYPFHDNEFEEIFLDHVIEHLENPLAVIEELFRIAKNNANIIIKCPHFSCAWLHPGHRSAISSYLFDYFDENHPERYGTGKFKVKKISFFWIRNNEDLFKGRSLIAKLANSVINFLANLNIHIVERVWCYWVGGFEEIVFEAEVKKD